MLTADGLNTEPHDPTEDCDGVHCYSHNVDEDSSTWYIACMECGHVYRTARALRRAYRREVRMLIRSDFAGRAYPRHDFVTMVNQVFGDLRMALRALFIRARKISFCQECVHDF